MVYSTLLYSTLLYSTLLYSTLLFTVTAMLCPITYCLTLSQTLGPLQALKRQLGDELREEEFREIEYALGVASPQVQSAAAIATGRASSSSSSTAAAALRPGGRSIGIDLEADSPAPADGWIRGGTSLTGSKKH